MSTKSKTKYFSIVIILIIALSILMIGYMWQNLSKSIDILAKNQINDITDKTKSRLDTYFSEIRSDLLKIKELTDNGLLYAEFNPDLNYLLFPIFNTAPQITTFAIARTDGNEYSLLREDSTWLNNLVYETDSGMNIHRERWKGSYMQRDTIRIWEDYNAKYDPRTRHWYKGAVHAKNKEMPYWSKPYKILFQTFPGITAAIKAKSIKPGEFNVVQYDILLSEITELTTRLSFSKKGKVFILSETLDVLGLPKDKRFTNRDTLIKYLLIPYDSVQYEPMENAVNLWKNRDTTSNKPFDFSAKKETWWGSISKYQLDNGRYFLIGVIVPESDFLSDIKRTKNIVIGSGILILIFILVVAQGYFDKIRVNNLLRDKNKKIEAQRDEISERNEEIMQQKEEIMAQRDEIQQRNDDIMMQNSILEQQKEEIEAQRDEIDKQHEILMKQQKELMDSINYAERIQVASMPTKEQFERAFDNYFILFKPRDIVSGDFYWFKKIKNFAVVVAADCTGHGIPGAFMSILGISMLNELITKRSFDSPGVIMNRLRKKIKSTLRQEGKALEQKDGMDMALCIIDLENKELQFAGAYNPLYLIRKHTDNNTYELIQKKANRQPIGIHIAEKDFTSHYLKLQPNDSIYIFSDGYIDQIGGENDKKFMTKRFKRLLLNSQHLNMKQQKQALEKAFIDWKGAHRQLDDILVIGIRL